MKLNNEEMIKVVGGAISGKLFWGIVGSAIIFLAGLVEGIVNPKKCN